MTRPKSDDYVRLTGTLLDRVRRAWHGRVVERFPAVDRIAHQSYGETHVTHILQKLNLRDRVQAVVLAYRTGPFESEPGPL